jgi:hypothetical protein
MGKQLKSAAVVVGSRVEGTYKRGGRDPSFVGMDVLAIAQRGRSTYLVGYAEKGDFAGQVTAVIANAFDPRAVKVTKIEGFVDEFDTGAHYFTAGSPSFSFVEPVAPELVEWVELVGGEMLSECTIDETSIPVVAE